MTTTEKTIHLKCDLRQLIRLAATDSDIVDVAMQMGLLSLLDTLAARASAIDDPEATQVLRILCLSTSQECLDGLSERMVADETD